MLYESHFLVTYNLIFHLFSDDLFCIPCISTLWNGKRCPNLSPVGQNHADNIAPSLARYNVHY